MNEILKGVAFIGFVIMVSGAVKIIKQSGEPPKNIEHDGHLFIQSKTGLLHHPACSCQSSLKAIRASK